MKIVLFMKCSYYRVPSQLRKDILVLERSKHDEHA